ncbi:hypothetical protein JOF56_007761 [Kibdelosporangium banguiense]|uniref:Ig-like domain-containing protein n=1 Tax=Kibdelosporangium banguiense TaxID=1365924 RepID=A0ABS4TSK7_9PSEU|nr:hypothetical protein [Kibdelosporangium banguiense]MBP2327376.1 hypothetical protein [Kibdelosporangium banguiense]
MIFPRVLGVIGTAVGVGLALAGCNNVSGGSATTAPPTVVSAPTSDSGQPATTATAKSGVNAKSGSSGGSGNSGGSNSGSSGGGKSTSSSSPPSASVTLSVKKQPLCPRHGTPDAPFSTPGQDVTITWKVTGATKAAISVDQPSLYGAYGSDYPASGELTLPFSCTNSPGKTTHTYTVWPAGNKNVFKTITVSATNNPST